MHYRNEPVAIYGPFLHFGESSLPYSVYRNIEKWTTVPYNGVYASYTYFLGWGIEGDRCGAGAGVPCVAVAESHSGETLPILFCVLVLFCTTAILNVPGGPGLRGGGVPAYAGSRCVDPCLGSGRPRGPPRARTNFLPSLYHAFVFLRIA